MPKEGSKSRAPNFTDSEIAILLDVVSDFSEIVDCKKTDATSSEIKAKIWKDIEISFNKKSTKIFRDSEKLKNCYKNVQKKARKELADEKVSIYKTGGGPADTIASESTCRIVEQNRDHFIPPRNLFDSDSHYIAITENRDGHKEDSSARSHGWPKGFASSPLVVDDPELCAALDTCGVNLNSTLSPKAGPSRLEGNIVGQNVSKSKKQSPILTNLKEKRLEEKRLEEKRLEEKRLEEKLLEKKKKKKRATEKASPISTASSSQESASGLFDVGSDIEAETIKACNSSKNGKQPTKRSKSKAPSRRLGSHIIASQRFSALASEKSNFIKQVAGHEDLQHQRQMQILDAQLLYEQERLSIMRAQAGFGFVYTRQDVPEIPNTYKTTIPGKSSNVQFLTNFNP